MKRLPGAWAGVLLMLALGTGRGTAQEAHPWVALVTQVQGGATVQHQGGTSEDVHPLTRLAAHDKLTVAPGGRVVMAFVRGGQRFTVTQTTEILESGVADHTAHREIPRDYAATLMPSGSNLDRLGGVSSQSLHRGPLSAAPSSDTHLPPLTSASSGGVAAPAAAPAPGGSYRASSSRESGAISPSTPPLVASLSVPVNPAMVKAQKVQVSVDGDSVGKLPVVSAHINLSPFKDRVSDEQVAPSTVVVQAGPSSEVFRVIKVSSDLQNRLDKVTQAALKAYQADRTDPSPFAFMTTKYEEEGCYEQALSTLQGLREQVSLSQRPYLIELQTLVTNDLNLLQSRAAAAPPP